MYIERERCMYVHIIYIYICIYIIRTPGRTSARCGPGAPPAPVGSSQRGA